MWISISSELEGGERGCKCILVYHLTHMISPSVRSPTMPMPVPDGRPCDRTDLQWVLPDGWQLHIRYEQWKTFDTGVHVDSQARSISVTVYTARYPGCWDTNVPAMQSFLRAATATGVIASSTQLFGAAPWNNARPEQAPACKTCFDCLAGPDCCYVVKCDACNRVSPPFEIKLDDDAMIQAFNRLMDFTRSCANCGELRPDAGAPQHKRCCPKAVYCSTACQRLHWPVHKLVCSRRYTQRNPRRK